MIDYPILLFGLNNNIIQIRNRYIYRLFFKIKSQFCSINAWRLIPINQLSLTEFRIVLFLQVCVYSVSPLFHCDVRSGRRLLEQAPTILHLKWRPGNSIILAPRIFFHDISHVSIVFGFLVLELLIIYFRYICFCLCLLRVSVKSRLVHDWIVLIESFVLRLSLNVLVSWGVFVTRAKIQLKRHRVITDC